MKKSKLCVLLTILMITSVTLFGCNNNFNKSEWNEAYKIVYDIYTSSASGGVETDYYCLVTEDDYNRNIERYHSESRLSWYGKLKKMFVKFDNDICYIKLISWGGSEEIKSYKRREIIWVDYI